MRIGWILVLLALARPVAAQDVVPVDAPAPAGASVPEPPATESAGAGEIVVTARGRSETLLDIPISVTTVGEEKFEQADVKSMSDVSRMVPNFYMDEQATGQRISIRGLGNDTLGASFDSSTGLSIDGLYFGRTRWFEVGLFDVEQVEILRGPQGVYFGKNTTAGLVNIRSRMPGDEWRANVRGGYETTFDERLLEAGVGGPVTETLRARLAGQYRRARGYLDNLDLDQDEPAVEQGILRGTLVWDATDDLQLVSKTQYSDARRDGQTQQLLACSGIFVAILLANNSQDDCELDRKRTQGRYVPGGYIDHGGRGEILDNRGTSQALTVRWTRPGYTVSSVTGYHHLDVEFTVDPDFSDVPLGYTARPEYFRQISQELRFETTGDSWFEVLGGLYYDDTRLNAKAIVDLNGLAAVSGVGGGILQDIIPALSDLASVGGTAYKQMTQDNDSWAAFGELRFRLTDTLNLFVGGRYTEEDRKVLLTQELGGLGAPFGNDPGGEAFFTAIQWSAIHLRDGRTTSDFSPSAILRWDFEDDGRVYASFVEGFKSGGFDLDVVSQSRPDAPIDGFEFGDEQVKSYEVGLKKSFLGGRLRLSSALYRSEYADLQVQTTYGFLQVKTLNAARATTQGFEIDAVYAVDEHWDVNLALGLSDAKYDRFDEDAPCWGGQSSAEGCRPDNTQDLSNKTLPLAPKASAALGVGWRGAIVTGVDLRLSADVVYRDAVVLALDRDPLAYDGDLTLFNAYVGIASPDDTWSLGVIAKNVFDEEYQTGYLDVTLLAGNGGATQGPPRTIATQFRYNF